MRKAARAIGMAMVASALACSIDDRALTVRKPAILLLPDGTGSVNGTNDAGIRGSWYPFVDTPDCLASGDFTADQCSQIFTPPSPVFAPSDVATGRMCTSGISARILDGAQMWGAGIQLNLNGTGMGPAYDAAAHMITGFSFEIDNPPPGAMAVRFQTTAHPIDGQVWSAMSGVSPVVRGFNRMRWADFEAPFDEHTLLSLQFFVVVNADHATPFDYCVWNLAARTD